MIRAITRRRAFTLLATLNLLLPLTSCGNGLDTQDPPTAPSEPAATRSNATPDAATPDHEPIPTTPTPVANPPEPESLSTIVIEIDDDAGYRWAIRFDGEINSQVDTTLGKPGYVAVVSSWNRSGWTVTNITPGKQAPKLSDYNLQIFPFYDSDVCEIAGGKCNQIDFPRASVWYTPSLMGGHQLSIDAWVDTSKYRSLAFDVDETKDLSLINYSNEWVVEVEPEVADMVAQTLGSPTGWTASYGEMWFGTWY